MDKLELIRKIAYCDSTTRSAERYQRFDDFINELDLIEGEKSRALFLYGELLSSCKNGKELDFLLAILYPPLVSEPKYEEMAKKLIDPLRLLINPVKEQRFELTYKILEYLELKPKDIAKIMYKCHMIEENPALSLLVEILRISKTKDELKK